jgi:hypothetical protein
MNDDTERHYSNKKSTNVQKLENIVLEAVDDDDDDESHDSYKSKSSEEEIDQQEETTDNHKSNFMETRVLLDVPFKKFVPS